MTYFKQAIKEVAKAIDNYKIIVDKSTVPVGTGDRVKKEIKNIIKRILQLFPIPSF